MSQLTKEWLNTQIPRNNEINQIPSENQEEYLNLYSGYYQLFLKYLINQLDLKSFDEKIKQSNLQFQKIKLVEDMDIYQYLSSSYLDYFYVHNNVSLNHLTDLEKEELKEILGLNHEEITSLEENFILRTYQKCMLENKEETGEMLNYGPPALQFYKPSNAIIIGFRYDEYEDDLDQTDEEWDVINDKRQEWLEKFLETMEQGIDSKLPIPVRIIWYDEYSSQLRENQINEIEPKSM